MGLRSRSPNPYRSPRNARPYCSFAALARDSRCQAVARHHGRDRCNQRCACIVSIKYKTVSAGVGVHGGKGQGDRKGPHPAPHHSRPYYETPLWDTPRSHCKGGSGVERGGDPCGRPDLYAHFSSEEVIESRKECEAKREEYEMLEWKAVMSPEVWAQSTFGEVRLGDKRRTERAVKLAEAMAREPNVSLPKQVGQHKEVQAAYRFLQSGQVSYEALMRPHVQQTRAQYQERSVVLLVQDTTELDYQAHPKTSGLGP